MKLSLVALAVLIALPASAEPQSLESAAGAPAFVKASWEQHFQFGPLTEKLHRQGFSKLTEADYQELWRSCAPRGELVLCLVAEMDVHEEYAHLYFRAFARDGAYLKEGRVSPSTTADTRTGMLSHQTGDFAPNGGLAPFYDKELFDYLALFQENGRFSADLFAKRNPHAADFTRKLEAQYAAARAARAQAESAVLANSPDSYDGLTAAWAIGDDTLRVSIEKNGLHRVMIAVSGSGLYDRALYSDAAVFLSESQGLAAYLAELRTGKRRAPTRHYFPSQERR